MDNMDKSEVFRSLVNLAAVDGRFAAEEVAFLVDRAERWGIPSEEFEEAIAGLQSGIAEVTIPESYEDRVELMKEMIRLMAIDGELADEEKKLCARVSANMDFSGPEFDRILVDVIEKGRLGEM